MPDAAKPQGLNTRINENARKFLKGARGKLFLKIFPRPDKKTAKI
jgi:hypothetical protein